MAYYNVLFDRAVDEAFELIGCGLDYVKSRKHSCFTAEVHVRYPARAARRRSGAGDIPAARFRRQAHALLRAAVPRRGRLGLGDLGEHVAARGHGGGKTAPFPPEVATCLARMKQAHAKLPVPEAAGRKIAMPAKG